jgi:hypothetical protein
VISVDTKQKELIGNFKQADTDYRSQGSPQRVNVHDFEDKTLGKAIIYDLTDNSGWVSVGVTHSPSRRSGAGSKRWDVRAIRLLAAMFTADCSGSNGARACGYGKLSCRSSPTRLALPSPSVSATIRQAPRSGTGSSTACSGPYGSAP